MLNGLPDDLHKMDYRRHQDVEALQLALYTGLASQVALIQQVNHTSNIKQVTKQAI